MPINEEEHYLIGEIAERLIELSELEGQEGYVSVPFSWLVKFCTHIEFEEPMSYAEREKLWKQKLKQQFNIDIPLKERNYDFDLYDTPIFGFHD